jgi:hypothetical protein
MANSPIQLRAVGGSGVNEEGLAMKELNLKREEI